MSNKEFTMEIEDGFDFIIEESGNSSLNLRKISWNGREPKLDLRKWNYNEGHEIAMKGVTLSDDGADELTGVLVEHGYGDTRRILKALKIRTDYEEAISNIDKTDDINSSYDDESEEYYDPRELLNADIF